jgi:hypothetical protein
MLEI